MELVDQALDVILKKVPDLATEAGKVKRRTSERLKAKNAAELAARALSTGNLTAKERALLTKVTTLVQDDTKNAQLPPTRITAAQLAELEAEAEERGVRISDVIRRRLFGE